MEESPSHIVLLNCDVCCSFPLPEMLEAHISYGGMGTILVIKVSPESANQFGELVADPVTNELLHYTEKPETFVSDRINCGVYIFTPDIFAAIQDVSTQRKDRAFLTRTSSFEALQPPNRTLHQFGIPRIHFKFKTFYTAGLRHGSLGFREPPARRIATAKSSHRDSRGLRDRRVRLSVNTAIQFYNLPDRLCYDQPSKAVERLLSEAANSIAELPPMNSPFPIINERPSEKKMIAASGGAAMVEVARRWQKWQY